MNKRDKTTIDISRISKVVFISLSLLYMRRPASAHTKTYNLFSPQFSLTI